MKKVVKITLLSLLGLFVVVFANGCYYVFMGGQDRSMAKIRQGGRLNVYECCSVYTMQMAMWMFGWPFSPEAAKECFLLHFPHNGKDTVRISASEKFFRSPKMQAAMESLADKPFGSSVHVAWSASRDYAWKSPERRPAIAVNACNVTKVRSESRRRERTSMDGAYDISVTCRMIYPKYSRTEFDFGKFSVFIHEGLLRYLQDIGWLSVFTAEYRTTVHPSK